MEKYHEVIFGSVYFNRVIGRNQSIKSYSLISLAWRIAIPVFRTYYFIHEYYLPEGWFFIGRVLL